MDCELARERIVAAAYQELSDEQAHELERHVSACPECQRDCEQVLALKVLMDASPVQEPAPNLVARARLRLDEALDSLPPKHWYERWSTLAWNNFARLQSAPIAAVLLLVVGAGAGSLGSYEYAQSRVARAAAARNADAQKTDSAAALPSLASVASVSAIVRQPNSEIVDVSYNQVVPRQIEGSLDDPQIRQLLMLATENASSPGVHDDSVDLLAAECRAGHSCQPSGIRDALMYVLRNDKSAAVRQKAMQGLQPYVSQDIRVRDAVLESLMTDSDPHIRSAAIGLLEPVEADTSVRQVLYSVSTTDNNPQIRNDSRQFLRRVSEIQ
jgi:hypothetical protein